MGSDLCTLHYSLIFRNHTDILIETNFKNDPIEIPAIFLLHISYSCTQVENEVAHETAMQEIHTTYSVKFSVIS